jgi:hypothetical protein
MVYFHVFNFLIGISFSIYVVLFYAHVFSNTTRASSDFGVCKFCFCCLWLNPRDYPFLKFCLTCYNIYSVCVSYLEASLAICNLKTWHGNDKAHWVCLLQYISENSPMGFCRKKLLIQLLSLLYRMCNNPSFE